MLIGIKYCGGCNCRYDRSEIFECLKRDFPQYQFEYSNMEKTYDFIVVISGCSSNCVNATHFKSTYGNYYIDSPNKYDELIKKLTLKE